MNESKPEWYIHLKEESFQGKPFSMEKIQQVEQRVTKWSLDADKRKRKHTWQMAAFSMVICLGVLVFAVLFNSGGADWIKTKVQTTVEVTQPPPETIPIRASGKTTFGDLQIVSKSEESIEALGAPSCLGIAKDFSIKGDYQVLFKNNQGKQSVVAQNELKQIIYPNQETIPLNKLSFKAFESVIFTPAYTDCHGIQFYMYGVTAENAFQFKFQTAEVITDSFSMGPNTKLQVIKDQLVVESGRAAADAGYALRYIFKPDLAAKTMVLVKTEKVVEKD